MGQKNKSFQCSLFKLSILFPKESFDFTFPPTMYENDGVYHTLFSTDCYLLLLDGGGDVY